MNTWESGRETHLLDDIIAGRKTIEGRLNRGKFALYRPGDQVWLRRDYRDASGELHNANRYEVLVEVIAIRKYASSLEMVLAEGYERVIPQAKSAQEAATIYDKYYSPKDQAELGFLAIEITFLTRRQEVQSI